ncbi:hypothetical protein N9O88_01880 [bacterium]|nr:hypothetical protein [bacterium]
MICENEIIPDNISIESLTFKKKKIKKRKFYTTKRNSKIVNAVTGMEYPWVQGSLNEKRLYKVIDSTVYYDEEGFFRSRKSHINNNSNLLYFDSPEQYLTYMKVNVDQNKKHEIIQWHENNRKLFSNNNPS